jgi:transcriptional regulator with XRE-family HTH domain
MDFATRLAAARRRKSQDEAASAAGVHRNTISRWERGDGYPDARQLARLIEFYGVDAAERDALYASAGAGESA